MQLASRWPIIPLFTWAMSLASPGWCATPDAVTQGLILDNVTVVDPRDGSLQRAMAVVIDGGRISAIIPAKNVVARGGSTVIDAHGKFVVPGYLDMHAHPLNSGSPETSLPLMLANGITGFRQMAGSPQILEARRQGQPLLPAVAPELLAMPGTVLAGPAFAAPQAVVAEILKQKAQGADFIKVVDLKPVSFIAAVDEATAVGLPFVGHLPPTVDVREAVRHGMRSVEHLGPMVSVLLSCSSDEAAVRESLAKTPPTQAGINFTLPPATLKRLTANPILLTDAAGFTLFQRVIDTYDERKCRVFAADMANSATWQVPTLIRLEASDLGNDPQFERDPHLKYMPADERQMWKEVAEDFSTKLSPEKQATLKQLFAIQLRLAGLFDAAGVKMLTGTDFGGQWIVPGFSLHQEFDLLGRAGVSPLHVLQMATLNGSIFLYQENSMGTVERGKQANLVVLDANPVANIQNLHRINAVVRDGKYYSRADLDGIEHDAEHP